MALGYGCPRRIHRVMQSCNLCEFPSAPLSRLMLMVPNQ